MLKIWDDWADENGDLGRVYGAQWRSWQAPDGKVIDQIANVVKNIKENPDSRRHLVVAYNPGEVEGMALPPCHAFFQFYVANKQTFLPTLSKVSRCVFLGVPFNIASYALLTMMMAQVTGLEVGDFCPYAWRCPSLFESYGSNEKLSLKEMLRNCLI